MDKNFSGIFHRALFFIIFISLWYPSYIMAQGNNAVHTIVIDAGHGGKDQGCSGASSLEKTLTLSIAQKVGNYLQTYVPDLKVIYTRDSDEFIELHERAEIANRNKADLFVSIHCNAISNKSLQGTETYVMGTHRNEANLDVALRENAVVLQEDNFLNNYDGFDPNSPETHIMLSLFQSAHVDQSLYLAKLIEDQFAERAGRNSLGVKQAGFLVLYKTTMPSVLIECGFLTNKTEENYLRSEQGQDYIASAIYRAIKEYKYAMEAKNNKGF
ncbi:MAG: N-acetylmuramoyl-L-alanine amidase [Bacteroidetes bacterium]|nr:N-acetylmuramoyl-L-alanine amidase [Bacteroidota bacterium]